MIDERRYLMVNKDEYEYIKRQFDKYNRKLVDKIMRFRNFTHWKYEISLPFVVTDGPKLFKNMTFTGEHEIKFEDRSGKFFGYDTKPDKELPEEVEAVQFIAKINLLEVSKDRIKAAISIESPEVSKLSGLKRIGRHIFDYTTENGIKISPAGDDKASNHSESIKMSHVFMTTLIYKLYCEENGTAFKALTNLGANVIYLNKTQVRDILEESEKYEDEMFLLVDYPLKELTIVSEGMFHSSQYNREFYGKQYIYYKVLSNDETLWQISAKIYMESAINERYLYVNAEATGLKGDEDIEVCILEDNIKLDETVRRAKAEGKDLSDINIDEYIEREHIVQKQLIASQYILVFQYIMYCMAKPKKTILKEIKETKAKPTRRKSHEKLREEITVLIKSTGYVAPRKPVMNPGSGSKHSYEYERRGGWCVRRDTGKRYWRKGTTCCQGRGPKATHVYEIRSEEDETDN